MKHVTTKQRSQIENSNSNSLSNFIYKFLHFPEKDLRLFTFNKFSYSMEILISDLQAKHYSLLNSKEMDFWKSKGAMQL